MRREEVDLFEKVNGQLEALHAEILALSKKSPNDGVNKFKLKFVNRVLDQANDLLEDKYRPFADFESFEEDDVPSNSDVTMILAQYLNCMEKLRSDNIADVGLFGQDNWVWIIEDQETKIRVAPPKKLKAR